MRNKLGRFKKGFHPPTEFKKGHKMPLEVRKKISSSLKKLPRKSAHVIKNCLQCKKEFRVLLWHVKRGSGKYCSRDCYILSEKGKHWSSHTEFKKGYKSLTPFKKGHIPWNKGKKLPQFSREKNPMWKGGKTKRAGYILVYRPEHPFANTNGYIREARLIIEEQIGRSLTPKEMPHHLNKIRDDNRPQNLMGFKNRGAHNRFERNCTIDPSDIIFDGRKYC